MWGGKEIADARSLQGRLKRASGLFHEIGGPFQHHEGRVSLIQMTHLGGETQVPQKGPAADAQDEFLSDARLRTAAVKLGRYAACHGGLAGSLLSSR